MSEKVDITDDARKQCAGVYFFMINMDMSGPAITPSPAAAPSFACTQARTR
jgi:hypothetical protein